MKKKKFRSTFSELISAVLFLVIGLILVTFLQNHYSTGMLIIGAILAVIGLVKIIRFFTNNDKRVSDIISLLFGIVAVGGSVVVFTNFKPILDLAAFLLGAYMILSAIMRFASVNRLGKEVGQKLLLPKVLIGIEILCGLFCLSARALLPNALFQAAGSALMGFGVLEIIVILLTAKARKEANQG